MKKYGKFILILIAIILIAGVLYFMISQNKTPNNNPSPTTRISTETDLNIQSNDTNINNSTVEKKIIGSTAGTGTATETEIGSFSTNILVDDDNRDNNLELTASKINGHIVKKGEKFSFNNVVGNPTPDKGYEKAGIIVNGKKEKGYGGGNCQISTTIYDAVKKVSGIKITERHEHGKDIGYVKKGQDATVVYDELDLKFENNTDSDIKIYVDITKEKVKVKITKLS